MSELNINKLEAKIAFLERHVEEQDKEILSLRGSVDAVLLELENIKSSILHSSTQTEEPPSEKPPHY